jgi:serine/threonine-protein kinase HipA
MPVSRREHKHQTVDAFLRGLLPDSDGVLKRWGTRYGVSPNNPFALLTHVGQDVAGAAQFLLEEDVDAARKPGQVDPVDDTYIGRRLRILRGDRAAWDDANSPGQFSLAGAQSKFALYRAQDGSWAVPFGRKATTHIFKPPLEHLAHQEVNEHLCLSAARRLGMRAAPSEVMTFGDERAIVVTRYDRISKDDGTVIRVHQEDFCQALSIDPARKYERGDGGPGAVKIIQTLREHQPPQIAAESVEMFCRALAYNWVIYGPDAHAKNYSLLLSGRVVRLAPFYDISSVAPYPDRYDLRTMVMAMSINGKFQNGLVAEPDWRAFAGAVGVETDEMVEWVHDVVSNAPDALADAVDAEAEWIRNLDVANDLVSAVARSAAERLRFLEAPRRGEPPTKPRNTERRTQVSPHRRADGTWVSGYPNPKR